MGRSILRASASQASLHTVQVTIIGDGSVIYTPTAGYTGQDTFAYTVADNQGSVSAPSLVTVDMKAAVTVIPPKGSGGGGAVGYLDIAALLALIGLRAALSVPLSMGRFPGSRIVTRRNNM
jgi:hypothetical protein